MAAKKNRKKKLSALYARSKILAMFMGIASFLYSKAECSISGKIFSDYEEDAVENSFICRLFCRLNLGNKFFRPLKRTVSKLISQSFIIGKANEYLQGWLYTKLSVYGLFAITAGVGFLLTQLLKVYGFNISEWSFLDMFTAIMFILVSFPLMLSRDNLNEAVYKSKTARRVLFDGLGCKKTLFEKSVAEGHSRTVFPIGVVFGIASWWVRPLFLMAFILFLVLTVMIFYIPETGIVWLIFLLPFLSSKQLTCFVIYVLVCFLLKYVRGKRTIKFDPLSVAVLIFALLFLHELGSYESLWCVCTFFLVINLIKSKKWIERCVDAVSASFLMVALYGVCRYISARSGIPYLEFVFKCSENESMISFFDSSSVFAGYLLTVFPLVLINRSGSGTKFSAFVCAVVGGGCMFLTREYSAWVVLLFGAVMFFVLYSKKTLAGIGIVLCSLPFVVINLPRGFLEKMSYSRISDYVLSISDGGKHLFLNGIAMAALVWFSFVVFLFIQKNITLYSRGCSQNGKLVSLGAMSGVISFWLWQSNVLVFADYRVGIMFWLTAGIASCVSVSERSNANISLNEFEYGRGDEK